MRSVVVFAPAKVNLSLSITGKRDDGFHSLVSVVAMLQFGDLIWVKMHAGDGQDVLECALSDVPTGEENLILQAADRFRWHTGWRGRFHFKLQKRIPLEAGLGGGSSNAIAALRAMSQLAGRELSSCDLHALAESLGSDCPVFVSSRTAVLRGRGEKIEHLPESVVTRLSGYRVLVAKPVFGVSTRWAFQQFSKHRHPFSHQMDVDASLEAWVRGRIPLEAFMKNDFEPVVGRKYLALAELIHELRKIHGLQCLLCGSGSAVLCISKEEEALAQAAAHIYTSMGNSISCIRTAFASR